jgi:hypothetical protein
LLRLEAYARFLLLRSLSRLARDSFEAAVEAVGSSKARLCPFRP